MRLAVDTVAAPAEQFTLQVRGGDAPALVVAWDRMRGSVPIDVRFTRRVRRPGARQP